MHVKNLGAVDLQIIRSLEAHGVNALMELDGLNFLIQCLILKFKFLIIFILGF